MLDQADLGMVVRMPTSRCAILNISQFKFGDVVFGCQKSILGTACLVSAFSFQDQRLAQLQPSKTFSRRMTVRPSTPPLLSSVKLLDHRAYYYPDVLVS